MHGAPLGAAEIAEDARSAWTGAAPPLRGARGRARGLGPAAHAAPSVAGRMVRALRHLSCGAPGAGGRVRAPHRRHADLPEGFSRRSCEAAIATLAGKATAVATAVATRKASAAVAGRCWRPLLPELFGGSADLTGIEPHRLEGRARSAGRDQPGRHLSWGVREFGMAAALNGMALHGGFIPYGGTFLTFSDYSRNAVRMAALMKQRVIHVFTHDSIGLGEDGPTHQSVEHVPSPAPDPRTWTSGARPTPQETAVAWSHSRAAGATAPARWRCRARRCRWPPPPRRRDDRSPAAATC